MNAITQTQFNSYTDLLTATFYRDDTSGACYTLPYFFQENQGTGLLHTQLNVASSKRYSFEQNKRRECLKKIFQKAFEKSPVAINNMTKTLMSNASYYSSYKRVVWIHGSELISGIFASKIVKIIAVVSSTYVLWGYSQQALAASELFVSKAVPVIINNTPVVIIQAGNTLASAFTWVMENTFNIFIITYLAQRILRALPFERANRLAERLSPWKILLIFPSDFFGFFYNHCFYPTLIWNSFNSISYYFKDIAINERALENAQNKKIALHLLLKLDEQFNPKFYEETQVPHSEKKRAVSVS